MGILRAQGAMPSTVAAAGRMVAAAAGVRRRGPRGRGPPRNAPGVSSAESSLGRVSRATQTWRRPPWRTTGRVAPGTAWRTCVGGCEPGPLRRLWLRHATACLAVTRVKCPPRRPQWSWASRGAGNLAGKEVTDAAVRAECMKNALAGLGVDVAPTAAWATPMRERWPIGSTGAYGCYCLILLARMMLLRTRTRLVFSRIARGRQLGRHRV